MTDADLAALENWQRGVAPNRLDPDVRYRRDPAFRMLVDMLISQLRQNTYTPTELREAVILAAVIHESTVIRPLIMELRADDGR